MIVVHLHLFPCHTFDRGSSFSKKEEHVYSSFRRLIYTRRNRLAQSSRLVGSRFQLSLVSHLFRIILKVFPGVVAEILELVLNLFPHMHFAHGIVFDNRQSKILAHIDFPHNRHEGALAGRARAYVALNWNLSKHVSLICS